MPCDASNAGFSTSHASRMSWSASEKKICSGSSVSASSFFMSASYASPDESAFWKIVGLDVTPVTASSSIIRFSSPVWTSSRESVSNQTDCPRAASSCRRDFAILHRPFQLGDLHETGDVALAAVEGRVQKCRHEVPGERRADDLGAETEHVHVVVFDALVGGVRVVADRGADPGQLAGRDRGADARTAHEHRALGVAALDRLADLARLVGIVDPNCVGVRPEVDHLVAGEHVEDSLTQVDAAVVEGHRDVHSTSTRAMRPSSNVKRSGNVRPSACTIATA